MGPSIASLANESFSGSAMVPFLVPSHLRQKGAAPGCAVDRVCEGDDQAVYPHLPATCKSLQYSIGWDGSQHLDSAVGNHFDRMHVW